MGRGAQPSLSWCPIPAAVTHGPGTAAVLWEGLQYLRRSPFTRGTLHRNVLFSKKCRDRLPLSNQIFFGCSCRFLYTLPGLCVNAVTLSAPL